MERDERYGGRDGGRERERERERDRGNVHIDRLLKGVAVLADSLQPLSIALDTREKGRTASTHYTTTPSAVVPTVELREREEEGGMEREGERGRERGREGERGREREGERERERDELNVAVAIIHVPCQSRHHGKLDSEWLLRWVPTCPSGVARAGARRSGRSQCGTRGWG